VNEAVNSIPPGWILTILLLDIFIKKPWRKSSWLLLRFRRHKHSKIEKEGNLRSKIFLAITKKLNEL